MARLAGDNMPARGHVMGSFVAFAKASRNRINRRLTMLAGAASRLWLGQASGGAGGK
jgi:hypothetical protein